MPAEEPVRAPASEPNATSAKMPTAWYSEGRPYFPFVDAPR